MAATFYLHMQVVVIVGLVLFQPSGGLSIKFSGFQGLCSIPRLRALLSFCPREAITELTTEPTTESTTEPTTEPTNITCAYSEWGMWAEVRFARQNGRSCGSDRAIEYERRRVLSSGETNSCIEPLAAKTVRCPLSFQEQIAELQKALGGHFGKGLGGTEPNRPAPGPKARPPPGNNHMNVGPPVARKPGPSFKRLATRRRRFSRPSRPRPTPAPRPVLPPGPTVTREIVLVLDASGSVGRVSFERMVDNLADLLGNLCYQFTVPGAPSDVRLALIVYSSTVRQVFNFADSSRRHLTLAAIKESIKAAKKHYTGRLTATGPVLRFCYNILFPTVSRSTDNVKRRILLVTDGRANSGEKPAPVARQLFEEKGVQVFPVGVGDNVDLQELRAVRQVDGNSADFLPLLLLNDYSALRSIASVVESHLEHSQAGVTCVRNFFK